MNNKILFWTFGILFASINAAQAYQMVAYQPMSQAECLKYKSKLGLRFCPYDNDHLAGAAKACGGIHNLPSGDELLNLAHQLYKNIEPGATTTLYGQRDDDKMKKMGIWVNDSHIYYWTGEEAKDGVGGYVRMFAAKGSIPYYAPRDGSGYVSHRVGKINYGETKNIVPVIVNTETGDIMLDTDHDSNLAGLPNNDALVTICR
ncbi:MAG: hypothetical protein IKR92_03835 [Alphaproteobacteria bacterium]|nr:hypothetical protein [Alphaproteobacteria bacterium]